MAIIGGAISDIADLESATQQTGDEAGEFFAEVRGKADAFNGDIEDMVTRLKSDIDEFGALIEERASALARTAEGTEWHGLAADAKRQRMDEMHAHATSFQNQAMANAETFRGQLQGLVSNYYDHIATEMGATITEMQEVHTSEAQHTASYNQSLQDIDQQFAG